MSAQRETFVGAVILTLVTSGLLLLPACTGSTGAGETDEVDGDTGDGDGDADDDGDEACDEDGNPCTQAVLTAQNVCSHEPVADGTPCTGGTCQAGQCQPGTPPGPCEGVTCSGHGTCTVDGAQAVCECDDGYRAEALTCVLDGPTECEELTFRGDWETGLVTGDGNENWGYKEVVDDQRFRVIDDGTAREGVYYARVEVRPGEDGWGGGDGSSERAEVSHMQDANGDQIYENEDSGVIRYTVSVKLDPSWQAPQWGVFLQLHGDNGSNPDWALAVEDEFGFNERFCLNPAGVTRHDFSNGGGDLNLGEWIDFVITIKYALDDSGWVTVMRRNEGETEFTEVLNLPSTCTLQPPDLNDGNHYMKHGYYRDASDFTSILYLDGFTRSEVIECP